MTPNFSKPDGMDGLGLVVCEGQAFGLNAPMHLRSIDTRLGMTGADAVCGALVGWDRPDLPLAEVIDGRAARLCDRCRVLSGFDDRVRVA